MNGSDATNDTTLPLGAHVTFDRRDIITRETVHRPIPSGPQTWRYFDLPVERRWEKLSDWVREEQVSGVIVGVRNLSNGEVESDYDNVHIYIQKETFRAYLVAYDLRRNIVRVRVEDVHP